MQGLGFAAPKLSERGAGDGPERLGGGLLVNLGLGFRV